jgi:hypothetical protein
MHHTSGCGQFWSTAGARLVSMLETSERCVSRTGSANRNLSASNQVTEIRADQVVLRAQTVTSVRVGSSAVRSSGSEVSTVACRGRASSATCASTTSDVPDLASSSPKRYATSSKSESTRIALFTPRHREFARPHQTVERGTRRPRDAVEPQPLLGDLSLRWPQTFQLTSGPDSSPREPPHEPAWQRGARPDTLPERRFREPTIRDRGSESRQQQLRRCVEQPPAAGRDLDQRRRCQRARDLFDRVQRDRD